MSEPIKGRCPCCGAFPVNVDPRQLADPASRLVSVECLEQALARAAESGEYAFMARQYEAEGESLASAGAQHGATVFMQEARSLVGLSEQVT